MIVGLADSSILARSSIAEQLWHQRYQAGGSPKEHQQPERMQPPIPRARATLFGSVTPNTSSIRDIKTRIGTRAFRIRHERQVAISLKHSPLKTNITGGRCNHFGGGDSPLIQLKS